LLQVSDHFGRVRAEFPEPDAVLGLGDGYEVFDGVLRFITG
jgi:hypothetical protein